MINAGDRKNGEFIFHARYPQNIEMYQRQFETVVLPAHDGLAEVKTEFSDNFSSFELLSTIALHNWEIRKAHINVFRFPYGKYCHAIIDKFPHLVGLKGLPGFTKELKEIIGKNHGCHHLFVSLVEMMRTSKQLAVVPASLSHLLDFEDSLKMRQLDILLFPHIGNSCWAYNLESGSLFPSSGTTRLNSSMYPLEGKSGQPFQRIKTVTVIPQDGHFKWLVNMKDNVHDITLELIVDHKEDLILNTSAWFEGFPYNGICQEMAKLVNRLEGSEIDGQFRGKVYSEIGGSRGCTHLVDFFIDVTDLYPLLKVTNGSFEGIEGRLDPHRRDHALRRYPTLKGSCCAFSDA